MSDWRDADDAVSAAVDAALGALIVDKDVVEVDALEGGFLEVVRRGRRERLGVILEGPLFSLLRDAGADKALIHLKLRNGRLYAGPLVDGRTALRIEKAAALDATVERLVEEGVLPPGIAEELIAAILDGAGLIVLGPARATRQRVLAAVVRAMQGRVHWFGLSDALSGLVPVALERASPTLERARAAVALGADALCAIDVSPADLAELARASLGLPLAVSVTASSMDALAAVLGVAVVAAAGQSAVIGYGPDGRPRLVELHGPTRQPANSGPAPRQAARSQQDVASVLTPAEVSGLRARPSVAPDDGIPAIAELPAGWASDAPDDDPGWELGEPAADSSEPAAMAGSFDAALAAQKGRPTFAPKAPRPHPSQSAGRPMRGDPFGGLTFEPPPGGQTEDDEGDR